MIGLRIRTRPVEILACFVIVALVIWLHFFRKNFLTTEPRFGHLTETLKHSNRTKNVSTPSHPENFKLVENIGVALVSVVQNTYATSTFTNFSRNNKINYCKHTGCRYIEGGTNVTMPVSISEAMWEKISKVVSVLEFGYPIVWMLDFDTIIMDKNFIVADLVDFEHDVFITLDCNGMNAGSVLFRNTPWTMKFIKEIWKLKALNSLRHEEQGAMEFLLRNNWNNMKNHFKFLDQNAMNSYPVEIGCTKIPYQNGKDPVLHFASCAFHNKCQELFNKYMNDTNIEW